eukprot:328251-Pelagomonas_calceolata.AAC.2
MFISLLNPPPRSPPALDWVTLGDLEFSYQLSIIAEVSWRLGVLLIPGDLELIGDLEPSYRTSTIATVME